MGKKLNLINKQFGKLIVVGEVPKEERKNLKIVEWECLCECGKNTRVRTNYLTSGHTKSCGCARAETMSKTMKTNLIGNKYGKLTVVAETEERASDGCVIWECQCECGNVAYVNTNSLKREDIISCGCVRSLGERKINQLLFELGYNYQTQFWFKDLKDKKYLYFDFAIFNEDGTLKCLIEYQGDIHFGYNNRGWNTEERFARAVRHDKMKKEYCEKNNIKLIEISYFDFDKIDKNFLENKLSL